MEHNKYSKAICSVIASDNTRFNLTYQEAYAKWEKARCHKDFKSKFGEGVIFNKYLLKALNNRYLGLEPARPPITKTSYSGEYVLERLTNEHVLVSASYGVDAIYFLDGATALLVGTSAPTKPLSFPTLSEETRRELGFHVVKSTPEAVIAPVTIELQRVPAADELMAAEQQARAEYTRVRAVADPVWAIMVATAEHGYKYTDVQCYIKQMPTTRAHVRSIEAAKLYGAVSQARESGDL